MGKLWLHRGGSGIEINTCDIGLTENNPKQPDAEFRFNKIKTSENNPLKYERNKSVFVDESGFFIFPIFCKKEEEGSHFNCHKCFCVAGNLRLGALGKKYASDHVKLLTEKINKNYKYNLGK